MAGRRSATTASKAKGGGKPGKAQGRPDRVNTRSSSSSKKNRDNADADDAADDAAGGDCLARVVGHHADAGSVISASSPAAWSLPTCAAEARDLALKVFFAARRA